MKILYFILFGLFVVPYVQATTEFKEQLPELREHYTVLNFAGLKTYRSKAQHYDFSSNSIADQAEPSGVWTNSLTKYDSDKIDATYYISHFHTLESLAFLLVPSVCQENHGMLIVANSWGVNLANEFAYAYAKKCKKLVDLFVVIDGIAKPVPFSYTSNIWSYNCINYYQNDDAVEGDEIDNCYNIHLPDGHINTEWQGSRAGRNMLLAYVQGGLSTSFVSKLYGIDYTQVFEDSWVADEPECEARDQILGYCSVDDDF